MKITLENTDKVVRVDGVNMRLWEGQTDSGVPVVAFIARVAVPEGRPDSDYSTFENELQATRKPRPELAGAFDARMVL